MFDGDVLTLPGARRAMGLLIASAAVRALLAAGQAWALASALANLWGGSGLSSQIPHVAAFFACFLAQRALLNAQDARVDAYASARARALRLRVLGRVFADGAHLVASRGAGSVVSAALEGIDRVEEYLRLILPKTAAVVTVPLVLLAWVFPLDWVSGVIALVTFPFIILYMVILGHAAKAEAARRYREFQELSNHFSDSLRGLDTLRACGAASRRGDGLFAVSERFRATTMKTLRMAMLSGLALDLFATFSLAAVAIMLGFRLVDGSVALFPALFALMIVPEYFKPVREFAADYHASLDGKNALAAALAIANAPRAAAVRHALPAWDDEAELAVEGVGYAYPAIEGEGSGESGESCDSLHDVAFRVRGLKKVGIVGASGSGKSTLLRLLAGLATPNRGGFRAGGEFLESLDCDSWHRQTMLIPQHPYIFRASLRDNVAFYRPDASDAEVARALEVVGLESAVGRLPQGIDTMLGEGGRSLSGGQAHRIALARAFLDSSRKVLLFDEPTAHLDIQTELELKERMLPLMEGRLVFFATHRLHWLADMDAVVVMEGGTVAEVGAPDELLSREGALRRLVGQMGGAM